LRRFQGEVDATQAITLFQSWAAFGVDNSHGFQNFPATDDGRAAADRYFAKSLQNVSAIWGQPAFHCKCDDANFPTWSSAHELASWPRGAGVAYLSIELDRQSRPQLILGWRHED
jgi:hypothetical protein